MRRDYELTLEDTPDAADLEVVLAGLREYNARFVAGGELTPIHVLVRNAQGQVVGGLLGGTYWGWLVIDTLWVDDGLRAEGYGRALVAAAAAEALHRGCRYAHVDTMDFQAPLFYEKLGYRLFGTLHDIPAAAGYRRHWYWKELAG